MDECMAVSCERMEGEWVDGGGMWVNALIQP